MRKVLLSIIVFIAISKAVSAQTDYCKDITKTVEGNKTFYDTPTPGDKKEEVVMMGFTKVVEPGGNELCFKLGLAVVNNPGLQTDVSITFEDDDVLTFTGLPVKKGNEAPQMSSIVHPLGLGRVYYTIIPITSDQLAKFKTKKIKSYNIFGLKRVPGLGNPKVKIMAYANCIEGLGSITAGTDANSMITKEFDEMKNITTYTTPVSENIQLIKRIDASGPLSMLTFFRFQR